jgi:hypothetical protein
MITNSTTLLSQVFDTYLFLSMDLKTAAAEVCSLTFSEPQQCLQGVCLGSSQETRSHCTTPV